MHHTRNAPSFRSSPPILRIGGLFVAASVMLVACGADPPAPSSGQPASAATRAAPTPSPALADSALARAALPTAPVDEEALAIGARDYAGEIGVSVEEARRRLLTMGRLGGLRAKLEAAERDTFAGLWWQHAPEFRLVVAFTRDGEWTIRRYVEGEPYEDLVEVRSARATYAELLVAQEETLRLVGKLDRRTTAEIDVENNRVEVPVYHRDWFDAALREAGIRLPEHVAVVILEDPSFEEGKGRPAAVRPGPARGIRLPMREAEESPMVRAPLPLDGELVERDGCLRVRGGPGEDYLVVWPHGFRAATEHGRIVVLDSWGRVAARVGEQVQLGGKYFRADRTPRTSRGNTTAGCPGPYFTAQEVPVP